MTPNEGSRGLRRLLRVLSGSFRILWPCQYLAEAGHDVKAVAPADRSIQFEMTPDGRVNDVLIDRDIDVVILQRVTHPYLLSAISVLRSKGIAVVVDVDDDLSAIHPSNPAFLAMHPRSVGVPMDNGQPNMHTWTNLVEACKQATMVTTSTPALLSRYAAHGRGRVIFNHLPDGYFGHERQDSDVIGWPASLHSHPDDPSAVGPALARLVNGGAKFRVIGDPDGVGRAFGMPGWLPDTTCRPVPLEEWPAAVAQLGIGIAPLSDTRFNSAKSFLKPAELSACGVPWVASPRAEYKRLHAMGAGVLAERPKDWYRELKRLIDDPGRRQELSDAGREVAEQLRLRDAAHLWWEAWSDALKIERSRRPSSPASTTFHSRRTPAPARPPAPAAMRMPGRTHGPFGV